MDALRPIPIGAVVNSGRRNQCGFAGGGAGNGQAWSMRHRGRIILENNPGDWLNFGSRADQMLWWLDFCHAMTL
jgi:hypothetical protein